MKMLHSIRLEETIFTKIVSIKLFSSRSPVENRLLEKNKRISVLLQ